MSLSYYEQLTRFTYKHQQWVTQNHHFERILSRFLTILLCTLLEGMQRVNFYGFVFSFLYPAEFLLAHCYTPHFTQKYLHNFLMNALTVHSCTFANIFFLSQFLFSFPCPESFPTYLAKCCQFFCALTFLSFFFCLFQLLSAAETILLLLRCRVHFICLSHKTVIGPSESGHTLNLSREIVISFILSCFHHSICSLSLPLF